jgi:hypothetical protein
MPAIAAVTKDNAFYTALRTEIEKSTPTTPIDYSAARALGADNWIADALNFVPDSVKSIPAIGTAPVYNQCDGWRYQPVRVFTGVATIGNDRPYCCSTGLPSNPGQ